MLQIFYFMLLSDYYMNKRERERERFQILY